MCNNVRLCGLHIQVCTSLQLNESYIILSCLTIATNDSLAAAVPNTGIQERHSRNTALQLYCWFLRAYVRALRQHRKAAVQWLSVLDDCAHYPCYECKVVSLHLYGYMHSVVCCILFSLGTKLVCVFDCIITLALGVYTLYCSGTLLICLCSSQQLAAGRSVARSLLIIALSRTVLISAFISEPFQVGYFGYISCLLKTLKAILLWIP